MAHTMPKQKPGKSEQVVCTPMEFVVAAERRLVTHFYIDLAALDVNKVCSFHIGPAEDSLAADWRRKIPIGRWAWLNPPYSKIGPWMKKAYQSGRLIAVLVPASVGSNWWRDYVHGKAWVNFLNGRIQFVGHKAGYPKDLALIVYGLEPGYDIWTWKTKKEKR